MHGTPTIPETLAEGSDTTDMVEVSLEPAEPMVSEGVEDEATEDKPDSVLSFKPLGRLLPLEGVKDEFLLMQAALKKPLTAEIAARICEKSGSHLLKLVSPRVDGAHAVLRVDAQGGNRKSSLLPSTNAPDIPYGKVLYRPLEVMGAPTMSVVDHVLNPDDNSPHVLAAFAEVFGQDVLDAMRKELLGPAPCPQMLGVGEFPIVFVPRPGGGDLQVTPVAPALAFMGIKRVVDLFFEKPTTDNPNPRRGEWTKQAISSKPQNISGAIGGPRTRFLARMPAGMRQTDADLYRYIHGGAFPAWRDSDVGVWVLRYAGMLEGDALYNDQNTRAALDKVADRLLDDALSFARQMIEEARFVAHEYGVDVGGLKAPPDAGTLAFRRRWKNQDERAIARRALTSVHFVRRMQLHRGWQEMEDQA